MNGEIAYVPQQAWIFSGTVKENIVFGTPFVQEKFDRLVWSCALTDDLQAMPKGADTLIGK